MRVLIGYAMRSGSTVLTHVLGGHSRVRAYGDLSSLGAWPRLLLSRGGDTLVVKPPDLVFLQDGTGPLRWFDRGIWLVRDPRDSYLSSLESGYAYLFRRPGPFEAGIDVGLLHRWARIQRCYLAHARQWYLLRYEDLVRTPYATLAELQDWLELPRETLLPFRFRRRDLLHGGDYKVARTRHFSSAGTGRHRGELTDEQQAVFRWHLGTEMDALGYPPEPVVAGDAFPHQRRATSHAVM